MKLALFGMFLEAARSSFTITSPYLSVSAQIYMEMSLMGHLKPVNYPLLTQGVGTLQESVCVCGGAFYVCSKLGASRVNVPGYGRC